MTDYTYQIADELGMISMSMSVITGLVTMGVIGTIWGLNRIARALEAGNGVKEVKAELDELVAEEEEAVAREDERLRAAFAAGKLHAGYDEWRASQEAAL
jgi:hypothetical protein